MHEEQHKIIEKQVKVAWTKGENLLTLGTDVHVHLRGIS